VASIRVFKKNLLCFLEKGGDGWGRRLRYGRKKKNRKKHRGGKKRDIRILCTSHPPANRRKETRKGGEKVKRVRKERRPALARKKKRYPWVFKLQRTGEGEGGNWGKVNI